MRAAPVNLIGGFYADDSLPWSAQDTVNLLPFAAETVGTRTQFILRDAPGLRPLVRCGDGPIRGQRVVEGKLLVVSGNTLYQVSNSLVSIPRGTIPGTGPVSMTHNQRGTTNQVLIVNGAAGYVYDTSALTLTKITDEGYPGAFVADFVDGYLAQIEPRRRYWFHSALRDALNYNTLDRYEAEGQPDALVSLIVDHREVWVFGERSIEPFVNTGAATNTFQRASNTVIEQGCSARFSPAKLDNSVLWLDDLGIVRRAQGYTPVRVSTGPIERAIADLDWSRAFGFTWTDRGHAVYYLTFPDGQTWGYDIVSGVWHRRTSYGLDRWRVSSLVYWNGQWIAGDFREGLLYVLDWDYPHDGTEPLVRRRVTGVTHGDQARVIIPYAELVVDTGGRTVEAVTAPEQPEPPTITGDAPDSRVGAPYSFAYTTGGTATPLVVTLRSGALPPGVTLSSAGVLSGTPTEEGSYTWAVRVTDANGLYADLDDEAEVTAAGPWMFGPMDSAGGLAGDQDHYIQSFTLAGLETAEPQPLPDSMTSISRISEANGAVFMHGGTGSINARVSFNGGVTWTECDAPLFSSTSDPGDVFWNGNFYYWLNLRSADGITWSAIPNFPAGTPTCWLARESDGLFVVGMTNGVIHATLDDGATAFVAQANRYLNNDSIDGPFSTNGARILASSSGGIGSGYSDDLFATNAVFTTAGGSYGKFFDGVWITMRTESPSFLIRRSTNGATWATVQTFPDAGDEAIFFAGPQHWLDNDGTEWALAIKTVAGPTEVWASDDDGLTFTKRFELGGNGRNLVFVKESP